MASYLMKTSWNSPLSSEKQTVMNTSKLSMVMESLEGMDGDKFLHVVASHTEGNTVVFKLWSGLLSQIKRRRNTGIVEQELY